METIDGATPMVSVPPCEETTERYTLLHVFVFALIFQSAMSLISFASRVSVFWLSRCRSQISRFGYSDEGHDVHEMWCLGSDRFSYLFIHGKPRLEVPEALMMKMFKDRHDIKSDSGYIVSRYIPNLIALTYALDRKE